METANSYAMSTAPRLIHAADALGAAKPKAQVRPWEVARWGRLLSGLAVLAFTVLGLLQHPGWMVGTLTIAVILVLTSLADKCALHNLLMRLGAQEREDLFLPGGAVRPEVEARRVQQSTNVHVPTVASAGRMPAGRRQPC